MTADPLCIVCPHPQSLHAERYNSAWCIAWCMTCNRDEMYGPCSAFFIPRHTFTPAGLNNRGPHASIDPRSCSRCGLSERSEAHDIPPLVPSNDRCPTCGLPTSHPDRVCLTEFIQTPDVCPICHGDHDVEIGDQIITGADGTTAEVAIATLCPCQGGDPDSLPGHLRELWERIK